MKQTSCLNLLTLVTIWWIKLLVGIWVVTRLPDESTTEGAQDPTVRTNIHVAGSHDSFYRPHPKDGGR